MAAPQPKPSILYEEVLGQYTFSRRLIVKPITRKEADEQGLIEEEFQLARANAIAKIYAEGGNTVVYYPKLDHYVFEVPAGKTENLLAAELLPSGEFNFVEPDYIVTFTSEWPPTCFNDPRFANGEQWHHHWLRSCEAWSIQTGSPSIVVAVCDTGVDTTHPDLQANRAEAWDMRNSLNPNYGPRRESEGAVVSDNQSHGTHCIGIVAATANNGEGVVGVAPTVKHRSLKVNDGSTPGQAAFSTINDAITQAADLGDKIISVSWNFNPTSLQSRIDAATVAKEKGALVFNSAGNSNTFRDASFTTGNAADLILVGSLNRVDGSGANPGTSLARSLFSNGGGSSYGPGVQVWAPGSSILSTIPVSMGIYANKSGTSMACPAAAGVAALIWSRNPSLTPDQVKQLLISSADTISYVGADGQTYSGAKVVNSFSAVQAELPPDVSITPSASFTPSPSTSSQPTTPPPSTSVGISVTPTPVSSITPTQSISITPSVSHSQGLPISVTPTPSITPSVSHSQGLPISVTPTPSITPSVSQSQGLPISVTPSITVTPTSTVGITPSKTPAVSGTPAVTSSPSVSITPSITPSNSSSPLIPSPSITPSVSKTPAVTVTPTRTITPSPSGFVMTALPIIDPSITASPIIPVSPTPTPSPSRENLCPPEGRGDSECDPPFPPQPPPSPTPEPLDACLCTEVLDGLTGVEEFENTITGNAFVVDVFVRKDVAESGTQLEDAFYMRWPAAIDEDLNFYSPETHQGSNCGFAPTLRVFRGQWIVFRQQDESNSKHPIVIATQSTGKFDAGVLYSVTGSAETSGNILYRDGDQPVTGPQPGTEYWELLELLPDAVNCPCDCVGCNCDENGNEEFNQPCPNLAFRVPACAPEVLYYRHYTEDGTEIRGGKIVVVDALPGFECSTETSCTPHERPWETPLVPLSLGDTFYEWYTTTNNIISALDPLRIYDVKALGGLKELLPSENGVLYLEADVGPGLRIFPPTSPLGGFPQDCANGKIVLDIFGLPEVEVTGTVDPFEDRKARNQVKESDLFVFERFVDDTGIGSRRGIDPHNTPAHLFKVKAENMLPHTIAGDHRFTGKISFESPSMEINATKITIDDKAIELGASPFLEFEVELVSGTPDQLVAGLSHDPDGDHYYYEAPGDESDETVPGNVYTGLTGEWIVQEHETYSTYSRTEPKPPVLTDGPVVYDDPYDLVPEEYLNRGPGFNPNDTDGAGIPIHNDNINTPQYPELLGKKYSRASIVAVTLTGPTTAKLRVRAFNDVPFEIGKAAYTSQSGVQFTVSAISGQAGTNYDVNGGGIILCSIDGNKSILWANTTDAWTVNQNLAINTNYHLLTPFNIANGAENYENNSNGTHNYWSVHQYLDTALITGSHCLLSDIHNGLLNFAFVPVGVTGPQGQVPSLSILPCGGIYIHNLDCSPQFNVRGGENPNSIVLTNRYGVLDHTQQDRVFVAVTGSQTINDFAVGDVVGIGEAQNLFFAKADTRDHAEVLGIVVKQITGGSWECTDTANEGWLVAVGNGIDFIPGMCGLSAIKPGSVYFLSAITGGTLVECEPTEVGYVRKPVGLALSESLLLVTNYEGVVNGDYFQENPVLRLDDLRDVDAPITGQNSLQDGQTLVWNATTKMWENRTIDGSSSEIEEVPSVYEKTVTGNNNGTQTITLTLDSFALGTNILVPTGGALLVCDIELCGSLCYSPLNEQFGVSGGDEDLEGWTYGAMIGSAFRILNSSTNSGIFSKWTTTTSDYGFAANGFTNDGGYFNEFGNDTDGIVPVDTNTFNEDGGIRLNKLGVWNTGSNVTLVFNRDNRTISGTVTLVIGSEIDYIGNYSLTVRISNIRSIRMPSAACGTPVPSLTPSVSPSVTVSSSPSPTASMPPSTTPSASVTASPSATSSPEVSLSVTPTVTSFESPTPTPPITPSVSVTPSNPASPSLSVSVSPSTSPSITPSTTVTPTETTTPETTPTPTPSLSLTPFESPTPTPTPTKSVHPSHPPTHTPEPSESVSPTPIVSEEP